MWHIRIQGRKSHPASPSGSRRSKLQSRSPRCHSEPAESNTRLLTAFSICAFIRFLAQSSGHEQLGAVSVSAGLVQLPCRSEGEQGSKTSHESRRAPRAHLCELLVLVVQDLPEPMPYLDPEDGRSPSRAAASREPEPLRAALRTPLRCAARLGGRLRHRGVSAPCAGEFTLGPGPLRLKRGPRPMQSQKKKLRQLSVHPPATIWARLLLHSCCCDMQANGSMQGHTEHGTRTSNRDGSDKTDSRFQARDS